MTEQYKNDHLADESVPMTFIRILGRPYLRTTALRCIASIFKYFFFMQSRASFLPGLIPVSNVDHPLDSKVPFLPGKVNIYLDFVAFWVRSIGFLTRTCGRRALAPLRGFLESMGDLYAFAAEVYSKNLSTTSRPFYIARPRFFLIHSVDPHLMCIPSLHIMVVIRTYTLFREIIKNMGEEKHFSAQAEELRRGAMAITEAVLYVKQHSVNCISAAMYAMTKYDPVLFPPEEAKLFASEIFREAAVPGKADGEEIREHIFSLYSKFLSGGEASNNNQPTNNSPGANPGEDWTAPLLNFLKPLRLEGK